MSEVLDVSYDTDGEITQFLVLSDSGVPEPKVPSPENMLLYDPEGEMPFDGGLHDFLDGESALRIRDEPEMLISQYDEYSYILSIDEQPVETTPEQAETLLQGLYHALAEDDYTELERLYDRIMSTQVRRKLLNVLTQTFDERARIDVTDMGWLIDGYYLVDWNANMYYDDEDPDEPDYIRDRQGVKKDTTYEIVQLRQSVGKIEREKIEIAGDEYQLTQREMLFLAKVRWLLARRHYHPDEDFWNYVDRWADMSEGTADPDSFNL